MQIVIGLGNPGQEYRATRHNVGFMVIDEIARRHANATTRRRFHAELIESSAHGQKLVLAKPQTYMNLSGHAAREIVNWYHVPLENIIVIVDDMDLPFGQLRVRARGSAGGHNGLSSIITQLGTNEFARLRVGIGHGRAASINHVLSRFSKDEEQELPTIIERAADGVLLWTREGIVAAMNELNRKSPAATEPALTPPSTHTPTS